MLTLVLVDELNPGPARVAKLTQSLHRGRAISFCKDNARPIQVIANTGAMPIVGEERSRISKRL